MLALDQGTQTLKYEQIYDVFITPHCLLRHDVNFYHVEIVSDMLLTFDDQTDGLYSTDFVCCTSGRRV